MKNNTVNVKTFFHHYASDFDAIYGHTGKRSMTGKWVDKNFRKSMFLRFKETLKNTANEEIKSVLDIGCGPGRYIVEFLQQGNEVVGLDIAEGMIELAKQVVNDISYNGSVDFVVSSYLEHHFERKFDAACLMGFFDYIESPEDIFNKLKQEINKEIYVSFPVAGGLIAWQRKIRYKLMDCPLYFYRKKDIDRIMKNTSLEEKYEITDLGRDYFVKVIL